jgi:hypothetical protein
VVEAKACTALNPAHRGQTLDYLYLCGLHHGTLLNFGAERVQREFVSTSLSADDRRRYELVDASWTSLTEACDLFRARFARLLSDWGAFLSPILYRDALTHFLGGEHSVVREVDVVSDGVCIGTQKMFLLSNEVAIVVSSCTRNTEGMCGHLRRLLRHTTLQAIQWINLNHSLIQLQTVQRHRVTEA